MDNSAKKKSTTDRRTRKTEQQLQRGLIELLKIKSLKEVTIRELSELVDINRSTFYVHYHDIYDMVEKIEARMLIEFNEALHSHEEEANKRNFIPMFNAIFSFLKKYSDVFSVLFGKHGDLGFKTDFVEIARSKFLKDWSHIFANNGENPYYYYKSSFIVQGCIGLMQAWLERGTIETPDRMAAIMDRFVTSGMADMS